MAGSVFSATYEGCADTKKEALYALSENILSRVSTSTEQQVLVRNDDDVQSKVSSYSKSTTNLSLVDITYKDTGKEVCAVVHKDDQVKNTQKLLKQALLYETKNLPTHIDSKIEKLSLWLDNIKQLSYLVPAFLKDVDTDKEQNILNTKEKTFTDIYTNSIAHSESLFFKSCKATKEDAKVALNRKLFQSKKSEKEKGFFDVLTSIIPLSSSDSAQNMLKIFEGQLIYTQKEGDECVMLRKDELKNISTNMYGDMARISEKSLSKDPKLRYKEIDNLYEQLKVTKALMKVFTELYKENNFNTLNDKRELLATIREKTYPQFVLFSVSGAQDIAIIVDNSPVKNNTKKYLKHGDHTYKISATGMCPLVGDFSTDLKEDYSVSKNLDTQAYPTVIFLTDKEPNIAINGQIIKANIKATVKECSDESRYIAKFAGQSLSGEIDTSPGQKNTVELNFLTSKELSVFNDAKTKKFTTTSEAIFSESLTAVNSANLEFSISRQAMHGEVTIHESGSFKYVSQKGYVGMDSFEYEIETPQKTSAPKLVNIKIDKSLVSKIVAVVKEPQEAVVALVQEPKVKQEEKAIQEEPIEKEVEVVAKKEKLAISYNDFKRYVTSKELTEEFLHKVKTRFPEYFEKLRKEMTQN